MDISAENVGMVGGASIDISRAKRIHGIAENDPSGARGEERDGGNVRPKPQAPRQGH